MVVGSGNRNQKQSISRLWNDKGLTSLISTMFLNIVFLQLLYNSQISLKIKMLKLPFDIYKLQFFISFSFPSFMFIYLFLLICLFILRQSLFL